MLESRAREGRFCALAGALAAGVGMITAWGFSVDDALISGRVAWQIALGHGYRFNPGGPSVDCVTPLGWAYLLAPFAQGGPERAVAWASVLGGLAWWVAAAQLGRWGGEVCSGARRVGFFLCLASSLPLGAWAVAGMETGLVLALGVGALVPGVWGALCAGLAAALRPELVPWAVALSFGQALALGETRASRMRALGIALVPALIVAVVRWVVFGKPVPLALYAKPSDFEHGLRYAFGVLVLAGPALSWIGWGAWKRLSRRWIAVAVAFGVQVVILIGVGGDWMPLWRLAVPVFPGVLLVGAALAEVSGGWSNGLRALLLAGAAAQLHYGLGSDTRSVRERRAELIRAGRALLQGSSRVGGVDVGWLGAASEQTIVDFVGVTDPEVAYLAGGHTSKRLPPDFLERREVDALVLRRWPAREGDGRRTAARWAYAVDARAMTLRGAQRFVERGTIPLAGAGEYVVLRRRSEEP